MAPIHRSPRRQHRSRSSAISSSHDSSLASAIFDLATPSRGRPVISQPFSQALRGISRHHPHVQSLRQPRLSRRCPISNGSYFQGVRIVSRTTRETLAASAELLRVLNGGQALSSWEPTPRVASGGDTQQRSRRSRFDGTLENSLYRPTALHPTPLLSAWDADEPISNSPENYLYRWEPTHPASNEPSYGQGQQQQSPEPPNPSPRLPRLPASPVSPCERGPVLSEEQRNRLLRSMPGYQSSSSPTAEPTLPRGLHGRLAPVEEGSLSTDISMDDFIEELELDGPKAWPANGNTPGTGGIDWGFLQNAAEHPGSASDDWSMNHISSNRHVEGPFQDRIPGILNGAGPLPEYLPRGQGSRENDRDVETLAQQLQNQGLQ